MNEQHRLRELASYGVLDTEPEAAFENLVRVAARVADVPTAMVTLLDEHRQWFKARIGFEASVTDRDGASFCEHVVRTERELEVVDARTDPRFADHAFVTGAPFLVFYAGFPLVTPGGSVLGTLCVLDSTPHHLTADQHDILRVLADPVMTELELRRRTITLTESQRDYRLLAEHAGDIVGRHDLDGTVRYLSPAAVTILGYDHTSPGAPPLASLIHPDDAAGAAAGLAAATGGAAATFTQRMRDVTGAWRWMEVTLTPRRDAHGAVAEVYSATRDITVRTAATRELAERNALVQAVLESVTTGIVACDAEGRLILFNPATLVFHGLPADSTVPPQQWPEHFDLYRADGTTLLPEDELPLVRVLRTGSVERAEIVIAPRGLPARLVSVDGTAMRDDRGEVLGAVVSMTDITAARAAERDIRESHDALQVSAQALARSEARFRSAFESGPAPMCRLDADSTVVEANPATRRLLSASGRHLVGAPFASLFEAADQASVLMVLSSARHPGNSVSTAASPDASEPQYVEARLSRPAGRSLWCEVAITHTVDADGSSHLLVLLADIDGRKQRELELQRQAATDPLTGVGNRTALMRHLDALVLDGSRATVLCLDLDGFKAVNDEAGHAAGDEVLTALGGRLSSLVRAQDLVARLGGDEFVLVFADDGPSPVPAEVLVHRVREAVESPVTIDRGVRGVGVSVGVARLEPGDDAAGVLARGDRAMYEDKQRARDLRAPRQSHAG